MSIKNITYGFVSLAALVGVLAMTPAGVTAQQTIRNTFVTPVVTAASTYLTVRLTDGSSFLTPGTDYTQDAALTVASTSGPVIMGRASAAVPTDASADNDSVMAWFLRSGAQAVQTTFGGVLATVGNGAAGTGTQRVTIATDAQISSDASAIRSAVELADDDQTGTSAKSVISTATNNFTDVKTAAGRLLGMHIVNTTAALAYIKFYNDAAMLTGDCASATNLIFTMPIPASTTGAGFAMNFGPSGIAFSTGIGYCIVAGATTTDNTSTTTGIIGVVTYK